MMWRERRWLLILLSIVLLANVVFFFTYRVRQQARIDELKSRREALSARVDDLRAQRQQTESELQRLSAVQADIRHIYDVRWATPNERLTPLLLELRRLAEKSRLQPQSRSYRFEKARAQALGTEPMTISFGVRGSYDQVRQMINLVELSEQFVFIDEISLTGDAAAPSSLAVNLSLKTLFRAEQREERGARE
jgi:Tfp pilus assembly protein PilO